MQIGGAILVGAMKLEVVVRANAYPVLGESAPVEGIDLEVCGTGAIAAATISRLGGRVRLVSKIGGDTLSHDGVRTLRSHGVDTGYVIHDPMLPVAMNASVVVPGGEAHFRGAVPPAESTPTEVRDALDGARPSVFAIDLGLPNETIEDALGRLDRSAIAVGFAEAELRSGLSLGRLDLLVLEQGLRETPTPDGVLAVAVFLGEEGALLRQSDTDRSFSTLPFLRDPSRTATFACFVGAICRYTMEKRTIESSIYLANAVSALKEPFLVGIPTARDVQMAVPELLV